MLQNLFQHSTFLSVYVFSVQCYENINTLGRTFMFASILQEVLAQAIDASFILRDLRLVRKHLVIIRVVNHCAIFIWYYIVLYGIIWYYIVFYYIIQYYMVMYSIIRYYIVLWFYIVLYGIIQYYMILYSIVWYCIVLYDIVDVENNKPYFVSIFF